MELLGVILGFVGKMVLGYLQDRAANQAMRAAGAAQTAATVNKDTADAERRAASVDDLTPDNAADRLRGGTF